MCVPITIGRVIVRINKTITNTVFADNCLKENDQTNHQIFITDISSSGFNSNELTY